MNRYVLVDATETFFHVDTLYSVGDQALVSEATAADLVAAGVAEDNTDAAVSFIAPTDSNEAVDTTTVAWTMRLPDEAELSEGAIVTVYDSAGNASANNITVKSFDDVTTFLTMNSDNAFAQFYMNEDGSYITLDMSSLVV